MLKKSEHKHSKSPVHRCLSPCPGYVYNIYRICFKLLCSDIHTFTYWIFTHLPQQTYQWWFSITVCNLTSLSHYLVLSSSCHCYSRLSIWITAVSWYICTQPQLRTSRSVYVRANNSLSVLLGWPSSLWHQLHQKPFHSEFGVVTLQRLAVCEQ